MRKLSMLLLLFALQSCIGWGDMFARKQKIHGNYYLIEGEDGLEEIAFSLGDGSFIGRGPNNSTTISYAYNDSVFIIKTISQLDSSVSYTVVNWKADNGYLHDSVLYLDTIPAHLYETSCISKQDFQFIDVNKHHFKASR